MIRTTGITKAYGNLRVLKGIDIVIEDKEVVSIVGSSGAGKTTLLQIIGTLDLHSGNTARRLGLLTRKMNDWKAVEELTEILREFDPYDPVKYDFALFGIGVNKQDAE